MTSNSSIFDGIDLSFSPILAPMAGITSFPSRMINRKFGCKLAFSEMINARSLSSLSRKTQTMLGAKKGDRPLGIQLLGKEPCFILRALERLRSYDFDILDFNAACPMKKVVNRGEGAALLKTPKKLYRLLKLLVDHAQHPVTVKIRLGWDTNLFTRDIALCAQDAGVRAISLHGRTRGQLFSGAVDYDAIRQVKKALTIPLVASGDIFSAQLAKKMFDETGCDGIMVARGSLGNPWIFREIIEFLRSGKLLPRPGASEIVEVMKQHLDLCTDFYGEKIGVIKFRSFYIWYTRGFRGMKILRTKVCKMKTRTDTLNLIGEFFALIQTGGP